MFQFLVSATTLCMMLYILYLLKQTAKYDKEILGHLKRRIEALEEKVHGRDD